MSIKKSEMYQKIVRLVTEKNMVVIPAIAVITCLSVGYIAVDKEKPTIVTNVVEVSYGEELDLDSIDVTDNRDSRDKIAVTANTKSLDNKQLGSYEVEVTATDSAANVETKTIEVKVIDDKGPKFEVLGASEGYVVQIPVNGSTDVKSYIKAVDNVDGDVTQFMEVSGTLDTSTLNAQQDISLKVSDNAGNVSEKTFTFVVSDVEAPVITLTQGENAVVDYGSEFTVDSIATIVDNVDEAVETTIEGTVDTKKEEIQEVKIISKDSTGNTSEASVKVEVKDISGPQIVLSESSIQIDVNAPFDAKSYLISAIDNKDGDVLASVEATNVDTSVSGETTVTYSATDAAGNKGEATLTLKVGSTSNFQAVADAAIAQIGVNQDCTMLVTNSLKAIGIYHHGWPISYMSLGHVISYEEAMPGDIIYYADGGQGVAHVAIYIGNGQSIHGGWHGTTVQYRYNYSTCSTPIFIRIDR
ncbi:MAG: C40 family peptidase [Coprobacillaceae bacterium]